MRVSLNLARLAGKLPRSDSRRTMLLVIIKMPMAYSTFRNAVCRIFKWLILLASVAFTHYMATCPLFAQEVATEGQEQGYRFGYLFNGCLDNLQGDSADGQNEWNPISVGPVTTWTAPLCEKGRYYIQPFFFYNRTRGVFDADGNYQSLLRGEKKYQFQQQLFMQYGILDCLEIDGLTALTENFAEQGNDSARSMGFTDSYLIIRYCLFYEKGWWPQIVSMFQAKMPTGKYEDADPDKLGTDLMGTGSYDHGYGIVVSKRLKPFVLHADAIYNFPLETRIDGVKTQYDNYLNYDFGVEYFLKKGFNLMMECNGSVQGDTKEDGKKIRNSDTASFVTTVGVGWGTDRVQTLFGYQRTLMGTNTDANDAGVFTVVIPF